MRIERSLLCILCLCTPTLAEQVFVEQDSGSTASLRGLCVVNADTVWASGTGGEVLRTTDGGKNWKSVAVEAAADLDFRDVHAFDAQRALVTSAGAPARVYLTEDGGEKWTLVYDHKDERAFFDAMDFWDERRGIAFSDPVDGKLLLIRTEDGGRTWQQNTPEESPDTLKGEAGFAASGSCLAVRPDGKVWIGLGGERQGADSEVAARVLFSNDFGRSWSAQSTPLPSSQSSGVFSLVMADANQGVVVGGNYLEAEKTSGAAARTNNGGKTWMRSSGKSVGGYRSGVAAFTPKSGIGKGRCFFVAVGTNGWDISDDYGTSWFPCGEKGMHAIEFCPAGVAGWACGAEGRIVRIGGRPLVESFHVLRSQNKIGETSE